MPVRNRQAELEEKQQQHEALDTMFKATSLQLRETETALTRTTDQLETTQSALGQVPGPHHSSAFSARRSMLSSHMLRTVCLLSRIKSACRIMASLCLGPDPLPSLSCRNAAARCAAGDGGLVRRA